ncbi:HU family DNA-binding protein [Paraburkholderia elongata]|uniref:HU family DNA-binding protein n=1 Tax=Paraburkholderia elongata TaxID=2675747 RepID=UPI001F15C0A3|nr:HU family DNA-binding protein [Paraburkholderia elongata]
MRAIELRGKLMPFSGEEDGAPFAIARPRGDRVGRQLHSHTNGSAKNKQEPVDAVAAATGAEIQIPAAKTVKFTAGKAFKDTVNGA